MWSSTLVQQNGAWFPVAITQWCGYRRAAETDARGRIVAYNRRAYADLRSFAGTLADQHQGAARRPLAAADLARGARPPVGLPFGMGAPAIAGAPIPLRTGSSLRRGPAPRTAPRAHPRLGSQSFHRSGVIPNRMAPLRLCSRPPGPLPSRTGLQRIAASSGPRRCAPTSPCSEPSPRCRPRSPHHHAHRTARAPPAPRRPGRTRPHALALLLACIVSSTCCIFASASSRWASSFI